MPEEYHWLLAMIYAPFSLYLGVEGAARLIFRAELQEDSSQASHQEARDDLVRAIKKLWEETKTGFLIAIVAFAVLGIPTYIVSFTPTMVLKKIKFL